MKTKPFHVLNRMLEPVSALLTPEAARELVKLRFDAKTQAHLDQLARKCNDGKLTAEEQREYESYVNTMDIIGILQSKARSMLRQQVVTQ